MTRDYEEAARWYRKAAEQGDALAQVLLGVMYEEGKTPSLFLRSLRSSHPRCFDDPQYIREYPVLCGQLRDEALLLRKQKYEEQGRRNMVK